MSRRNVSSAAISSLLLFASLHAQRPSSGTFPLTVDSIMRGPDLVGSAPSSVRWSGDGKQIYFDWQKPGEDESSTYAVAREGGDPRKLSDEEARRTPPAGGRWDAARKRLLAVDRGDIVIYDVAAGRRHITKTDGNEGSARWTRNDTAITFVQGGNLFVLQTGDGADPMLTQLTNIGPRRADPPLTDSQRVLRDEEQKLLDIIRERAEQRKKTEAEREKEALPRLEISARQTVSDIQLSPDGRYAWVSVTERPAQQPKTADVPNYVTESAYAEMIQTRTNVGDAQSHGRLAVIDLQQKKSVWIEAIEPKREMSWSMAEISHDGKFAVAAARSADNKDRWLAVIDPASGKARVIDHLHDDAWVRGSTVVGRSGAGSFGTGAAFLADNRRITFLSERDGWMHLYTLDVSAESAKPVQLTSGPWEIDDARLSADGSKVFITSTEAHPGERHVYVMSAEGGPRTRLTTATGAHALTISPDGGAAADVFSYATKPPELYVIPHLGPGAEMQQVTTTPTEEWRSFKWIDPKLITYRTRDGKDVYARLYTPEMIGAKRDPLKPAVIFVHGAGYLQNAHKYWSSYYREYMFHNLLASRGYVVLDPDYRASAGYGRDWRTAIYRFMGGKDLEDVVDGAKYLAAAEKVDPKRIGVYGGSYGGFITLMAMFTTPDVFKAGAALRPVTDWAHYNHGYTSNILNVPQSDIEAYRRSSPIYHAAGLKGHLLIAHGMVDTNVHFQDSVRLAQRLIELRKEHWELAAYPVENHGFVEETSWADEYKRILKLFEENLRRR